MLTIPPAGADAPDVRGRSRIRQTVAPYRRLFAIPGAVSLTLAGLAARLPMSMLTLATLLLVEDRTGSYAIAAGVTAASGVSYAAAAPFLARLMDRHGQARVLRPTVLIHAAAILSMVLCTRGGAPLWSLFVLNALAGASAPSVCTLIRARWSHLLRGTDDLHTAFSLESAIDELVFMVGPAFVAVCAGAGSPALALVVAMVATVTGCLILAHQSRSAPPAQRAVARSAALPCRSTGVLVVSLVLTAVGALCGSISVLTAAFSRAAGSPNMVGPLLALWAVGSLGAGLIFGSIRWRASLRRRFVIAAAVFALATLPLAYADTLPLFALAMLLTGVTISPLLVSGYGLVESLVPVHARTQGLAWAGTGMSLGGAGASALAGMLIDRFGVAQALEFAVAAGPLALVTALAGMATLRPNTHRIATVAVLPAQRAPSATPAVIVLDAA